MPDQAFDTVSDLRDWLADEEPSLGQVKKALDLEQDGPDRKTAKAALDDYIERLEGGEDTDSSETESFVVLQKLTGHEVGQVIELDPDGKKAKQWRSSGRIRLV